MPYKYRFILSEGADNINSDSFSVPSREFDIESKSEETTESYRIQMEYLRPIRTMMQRNQVQIGNCIKNGQKI